MKLYIIGNGFDLHHGIPSSYNEYRKYLLEVNSDLVKSYENAEYFVEPALEPDIKWNDIEKALAIDYDEFIYSDISNYYPDISSENPGWNDMYIEVGLRYGFLNSFTKDEFYKWIEKVSINDVPFKEKSNAILIDKDARFITFNYTNTLEQIYRISSESILHIHGNANDVVTIQFGTPNNDTEIAYKELEKQYYGDDFYGASIEPAINSLMGYMEQAYKNPYKNFDELREFINEAMPVSEVIIMGHSYMGIDNIYYDNIIVPLCSRAKWMIYTHNKDDEKSYREFCEKYKQIDAIPMRW